MASLSGQVDGFRLAFDLFGSAGSPPVVLLHGWPGDRHDYRHLVPLLGDVVDAVVPDLRGFGESDKHPVDPAEGYAATAQARSIAGLVEELGLAKVVVGGYDIGSRIAQALARERPDLVAALVISPPVPGVGERILAVRAQREFWYQAFHQLSLADELIDGNPEAVRAYLRYFWTHWSGPQFAISDADVDRLVSHYARPGAFSASIAWYRAGSGTVAQSVAEQAQPAVQRIAVPTDVLWPDHDPLFPREWADRVERYFADVRVHFAEGAGHFTPLESASTFANLIRDTIS